MKVLLVNPYCWEERVHTEDVEAVPIGLFTLAATLRDKDVEAGILNAAHLRDRPDRIRAALAEWQPDLVGVSVLNATRWGAVDIARMAREINPAVRVVFGGVAATFLWEHFLTEIPEVDAVVLGEGEAVFPALIQALEGGDAPDPVALEALPGIAFRKNGAPFRTRDAEPIPDLAALPNPARWFTYQHLALTRGCPAGCSFCGSPRFWGRKVRFHSPRYFVDQMEILQGRGVSFFYVSDDTFTLKPEITIQVCKEIIRRGLRVSWAAISRVDLVDEEVLAWMRRAGCTQISYGVEHGDPEIRKTLGKRISDAAVAQAFGLTTRYGILPRAYFIYGCPGETEETVARTEALIRRIRPLSAIFYILAVFPGTGLYEEMKRHFGVTDAIWKERIEDILWFEYDPNLSKEEVLAWGKRLREGFHRALPDFVRKIEVIDDPEFAPLHADFFSRLGMTFLRGDYAPVAEISNQAGMAAELFRRSLAHAPDERAFLGLGMLRQDARDMEGAIQRFEEGIGNFPQSLHLNLGLGVSLMNLGRFSEALAALQPFAGDRTVAGYVGECERVLGRQG